MGRYRYEPIGLLGSGAFGSVAQCRRVGADDGPDIVAIKATRKEDGHWGLQLGLHEAKVLSACDHPTIVKLLDAFQSRGGQAYLVMEYVEFCANSLLNSFPYGLSRAQLKLTAWQMCLALRYLHRRGIIHRDIKPANILIARDGTTKLCDFGMARSLRCSGLRTGGDGRLTAYVITRWYRPPEVLLGLEYGPPADIFSLGCTFAELATGLALFPGSSSLDQLSRLMRCFGPLPPHMAAALAARSDGASTNLLASPAPAGRTLRARLRGPNGTEPEPQLMQFVEACLSLDPAKRLSADELLQLPYFDDVGLLVSGSPLEPLYLLECQDPEGLGDPEAAGGAASAADRGGSAPSRSINPLALTPAAVAASTAAGPRLAHCGAEGVLAGGIGAERAGAPASGAVSVSLCEAHLSSCGTTEGREGGADDASVLNAAGHDRMSQRSECLQQQQEQQLWQCGYAPAMVSPAAALAVGAGAGVPVTAPPCVVLDISSLLCMAKSELATRRPHRAVQSYSGTTEELLVAAASLSQSGRSAEGHGSLQPSTTEAQPTVRLATSTGSAPPAAPPPLPLRPRRSKSETGWRSGEAAAAEADRAAAMELLVPTSCLSSAGATGTTARCRRPSPTCEPLTTTGSSQEGPKHASEDDRTNQGSDGGGLGRVVHAILAAAAGGSAAVASEPRVEGCAAVGERAGGGSRGLMDDVRGNPPLPTMDWWQGHTTTAAAAAATASSATVTEVVRVRPSVVLSVALGCTASCNAACVPDVLTRSTGGGTSGGASRGGGSGGLRPKRRDALWLTVAAAAPGAPATAAAAAVDVVASAAGDGGAESWHEQDSMLAQENEMAQRRMLAGGAAAGAGPAWSIQAARQGNGDNGTGTTPGPSKANVAAASAGTGVVANAVKMGTHFTAVAAPRAATAAAGLADEGAVRRGPFGPLGRQISAFGASEAADATDCEQSFEPRVGDSLPAWASTRGCGGETTGMSRQGSLSCSAYTAAVSRTLYGCGQEAACKAADARSQPAAKGAGGGMRKATVAAAVAGSSCRTADGVSWTPNWPGLDEDLKLDLDLTSGTDTDTGLDVPSRQRTTRYAGSGSSGSSAFLRALRALTGCFAGASSPRAKAKND